MNPRKPSVVNPLAQTPTLSEATQAREYNAAGADTWVQHILIIEPATSFQYRFTSSTGDARHLRLERGALEPSANDESLVSAFRAGVYPGVDATQGGFYTSPDSVPLRAWAILHIEGLVAGDSLVCHSLGSWQGLPVNVKLYRDGAGLVLNVTVTDDNEHSYSLP